MAGSKPVYKARGKRISNKKAAGTNKVKEEKELYIADVPAGSVQDTLRDFDQLGYRCDRPWRNSPELAFEVRTPKKKEAPRESEEDEEQRPEQETAEEAENPAESEESAESAEASEEDAVDEAPEADGESESSEEPSEEEAAEEPQKPDAEAPKAKKNFKKYAVPRRPKGLGERMVWEIRHDKKGLCVCVCLAAALVTIGTAWGQKMVAGVEKQQAIAAYQEKTAEIELENEELTKQLEIAMDGQRIRNLAQNELGMLRPERAQTEEIYVRLPEHPAEKSAQEDGETQRGVLDFLLGLLSLFHIGE